MSPMQRISSWFNARVDLRAVKSSLAAIRVPVHRWSFFSATGGMTLMLLLMQVVSGVLLLLHYRPTAEEAHGSVELIIGEIPFGDLVRSVHVWCGDLFVALLIAHVFVSLVQRSYRSPRELLWLSGVVMFVISVGLALSGHLLPWTDSAYAAARVSTELSSRVPLVGGFLESFLRGGQQVTARSLGRFYGFHVAVLPAALTLLVAGHLWLINRQGVSVPKSLEGTAVRRVPYWPHIAMRDWARATALVFIVLTLAVFLPRGLGPEANPVAAAPPDVQPQWYFLWIFALLKVIPPDIMGVPGETFGVTALVVLFLLFTSLPFLDRRGSKVMFYVGLGGAVALLGVTIHALV